MSEEADPLLTFFTEAEAEDLDILYSTLGLERAATKEDISKAYRKAALRCHPDKHASKPAEEREALTAQFQRIGFAFAVLSDEKRRKRYDDTGRTDEAAFCDEAGWDAYFADLFERVDRKLLDADKLKYQGSEEEVEDIREAYETAKGNFEGVFSAIPHSTTADEERIVSIVEAEIAGGRLKRNKTWDKSSKDKAARKKRKRAAEKEAAEAEEEARRLGVWDEFYGSGKKGKRAGDDDKGKADKDGEQGLAALIRGRQNSRAATFAALEAKYANVETQGNKSKKGKGKKTKEGQDELDDDAFEALQAKMFGGKQEKKAEPHPDDLDDEAFAALQAKMFANKKARK